MTTSFTKRDILLGGSALTACAIAQSLSQEKRTIGAAPTALPQSAAIALFDSRSPQSATFAKDARAANAQTIDIATEEANMWRTIRAGLIVPAGATIIGAMRWSEWTMLRSSLEEQGFRLRHEMRFDLLANTRRNAASFTREFAAALAERKARVSLDGHARASTLFGWEMAQGRAPANLVG